MPSFGGVQGTPAGLFKAYKGINDVILVGSNLGASNNTFYMLDPVDGLNVSTYSHGLLGAVQGMEVVDYPNNRVFFLTTASSGTLWGFDLGPAGSPSLNPSAGRRQPRGARAANGSPVLRDGRLYFGTTNGDLHVYRVSDGTQSTLGLWDGEVKGFVFPDRRNGDLYFSTNSRVWGVSDTLEPSTPMLTPRWSVDDIPTPSIVLHRPGTDFLYVGGRRRAALPDRRRLRRSPDHQEVRGARVRLPDRRALPRRPEQPRPRRLRDRRRLRRAGAPAVGGPPCRS